MQSAHLGIPPRLPKYLAIGLLGFCTCSPLDPPTAQALCAYSSFESGVVYAHSIFVGTVDSVEPICEPHRFATRYHFRDVHFLKGGSGDTCSLAEPQGQCGTMVIVAEHAHTFRKGVRYVIFESQNQAMSCGAEPFELWSDSGSTSTVVHRGSSPVVAVDEGHIVLLSTLPWTTDMGIWTSTSDGGLLPPPKPPVLPLPRLIEWFDAEREDSRQYNYLPPWHSSRDDLIRGVSLFPHQDPGMRVGEAAFMTWLAAVIGKETALYGQMK